MRFRQSLMKYCEKYEVKRASRKYNKCRSYICFWKARLHTPCWEPLSLLLKRLALLPQAPAKLTYKPKPYEQMTHPGERVQIDVNFVLLLCLANKGKNLSIHRNWRVYTTSVRLRLWGTQHLFLGRLPKTRCRVVQSAQYHCWVRSDRQRFWVYNAVYSRLKGQANAVPDNRCRSWYPPQTHLIGS